MEHQFPFGTFRPGNQDYLSKRSVAPGNLPLKRPEKSCSMYFATGFSGKFLSTTIVLAQVTITITVARLLAFVAEVRKGRGRRGRELGRKTAREGGGRRFLSFLPRAPKFPLPLLMPATQATRLRVFIISTTTQVRKRYLPIVRKLRRAGAMEVSSRKTSTKKF